MASGATLWSNLPCLVTQIGHHGEPVSAAQKKAEICLSRHAPARRLCANSSRSRVSVDDPKAALSLLVRRWDFTFAHAYPRIPLFPKGAGLNDATALTVKDVADMLNVDRKTVYRLAQKRELPGFKVAGAWRFLRSDIVAWIDQQKP
jgi:excisionase family DNA binding protein